MNEFCACKNLLFPDYRYVQSAGTPALNVCGITLDARDQLAHGRLNSRQTCVACGLVPRGSYPPLPNGGGGDFRSASYWSRLNPLAGRVAPVGHRHFPEICDTNYLTDSGHGPLASGKDWFSQLGTITTSAGASCFRWPMSGLTEKLCGAVQTSAKAVLLTRIKFRGETPACEVGRVGLVKRVHKPVSWGIDGLGRAVRLLRLLEQWGEQTLAVRKLRQAINRGVIHPSGLLSLRQAAPFLR